MPRLIHVGNSIGVRIPKAIITQLGLKENTDLVFKVTDQGLLIAPVRHSREGWGEAFKARKGRKDQLFAEEVINAFDNDEWEW